MTTKRLPEGIWDMVAYRLDDEWVAVLGAPELVINAETVAGSSGLNRFTTGNQELPLGPMATTRMAGPPEFMNQEQILLGLIGQADACIDGLSGMFLLSKGFARVELRRLGTGQTGESVLEV